MRMYSFSYLKEYMFCNCISISKQLFCSYLYTKGERYSSVKIFEVKDGNTLNINALYSVTQWTLTYSFIFVYR